MKLRRLSGRKNCERVKTRGMLWKGRHLWARFLPGYPRGLPAPAQPTIYVGTLASTKLDKSAVKRNRMRRRCSEALRLASADATIMSSYQLLLMPRSSSLTCTFAEILADIRSLFSSLR